MTNTGWVITVTYTLLSLIGITIGLIVFRSTRVGFRVRTPRRATLERRESIWGFIVLAFLVVVLAGTIFQVPYKDANAADAKQTVRVTGRQFAWTVDPPRIRAHVLTQFVTRTVDVNHSVGIYDPDGRLIKQVGILPGTTQKFTITFDKPGTYQILCLEFCGLDHHLMANNLVVTP